MNWQIRALYFGALAFVGAGVYALLNGGLSTRNITKEKQSGDKPNAVKGPNPGSVRGLSPTIGLGGSIQNVQGSKEARGHWTNPQNNINYTTGDGPRPEWASSQWETGGRPMGTIGTGVQVAGGQMAQQPMPQYQYAPPPQYGPPQLPYPVAGPQQNPYEQYVQAPVAAAPVQQQVGTTATDADEISDYSEYLEFEEEEPVKPPKRKRPKKKAPSNSDTSEERVRTQINITLED